MIASLPLLIAQPGCNQPELEGIIPEGAGTDSEEPRPPVDANGVIVEGCLTSPIEGVSGYLHQCSGFVHATVSFTVDTTMENYAGPRSLFMLLNFGPKSADDSYEKPKVMACCSPIDKDAGFIVQPHHKACYSDLIENGCRSLFHKLGEAREQAPLAARKQLGELQAWIGDHQQECYDEFTQAGGLASYEPEGDFDWFFLEHTWVLPRAAWTRNIKNIELKIKPGYVSDAYLPPKKADRLACESQAYNNDEYFRSADLGKGSIYELGAGQMQLQGPQNDAGGRTGATAPLASAATGCSLCSSMSIQQINPKTVRLDALVLDSARFAQLRWDSGTMGVERFRVALYAPVDALEVGDNRYRVPANVALFLVSAVVDGKPESILVASDTAIDLMHNPVDDTWSLAGMTLSVVDFGGTWSLSLGKTTWE